MYKVLTIDGYDYKFEYTIEASLYAEGTEKLLEFLGKTIGASEMMQPRTLPENVDKVEYYKDALKESLNGYLSLPSVTLTLWYAGLMEHHGTGLSGDGKVATMNDAKELLKEFFREEEAKENGVTDFIRLLNLIIEQMVDDGFFKRIGLEQLSQAVNRPQDRQQRRKKASGSKS